MTTLCDWFRTLMYSASCVYLRNRPNRFTRKITHLSSVLVPKETSPFFSKTAQGQQYHFPLMALEPPNHPLHKNKQWGHYLDEKTKDPNRLN